MLITTVAAAIFFLCPLLKTSSASASKLNWQQTPEQWQLSVWQLSKTIARLGKSNNIRQHRYFVGYPCQVEKPFECLFSHCLADRGECGCRADETSFLGLFCLPRRALGESCVASEQCSAHSSNSECVRAERHAQVGVCLCERSFYSDDNSRCLGGGGGVHEDDGGENDRHVGGLLRACDFGFQCPRNARCDSTSKRCVCGQGFRLDGYECVDIDECKYPPDGGACNGDIDSVECINRIGSYQCRCVNTNKGRKNGTAPDGVCCRKDQLPCANEPKCVHIGAVCDGFADCTDASDESYPFCIPEITTTSRPRADSIDFPPPRALQPDVDNDKHNISNIIDHLFNINSTNGQRSTHTESAVLQISGSENARPALLNNRRVAILIAPEKSDRRPPPLYRMTSSSRGDTSRRRRVKRSTLPNRHSNVYHVPSAHSCNHWKWLIQPADTSTTNDNGRPPYAPADLPPLHTQPGRHNKFYPNRERYDSDGTRGFRQPSKSWINQHGPRVYEPPTSDHQPGVSSNMHGTSGFHHPTKHRVYEPPPIDHQPDVSNTHGTSGFHHPSKHHHRNTIDPPPSYSNDKEHDLERFGTSGFFPPRRHNEQYKQIGFDTPTQGLFDMSEADKQQTRGYYAPKEKTETADQVQRPRYSAFWPKERLRSRRPHFIRPEEESGTIGFHGVPDDGATLSDFRSEMMIDSHPVPDNEDDNGPTLSFSGYDDGSRKRFFLPPPLLPSFKGSRVLEGVGEPQLLPSEWTTRATLTSGPAASSTTQGPNETTEMGRKISEFLRLPNMRYFGR